MNRYDWLELQLDRDDLTDLQYQEYNSELNDLQASINDKANARAIERKRLQEERDAEIALARVEAITDEEVEKMYLDSCLKYQDVNGVSFEVWYAKSLKYYRVDDQHNVHARARSPNTVEVIPHVSVAHAKLTILTRIRYKFRDHAIRGYDFAYDLEEGEAV